MEPTAPTVDPAETFYKYLKAETNKAAVNMQQNKIHAQSVVSSSNVNTVGSNSPTPSCQSLTSRVVQNNGEQRKISAKSTNSVRAPTEQTGDLYYYPNRTESRNSVKLPDIRRPNTATLNREHNIVSQVTSPKQPVNPLAHRSGTKIKNEDQKSLSKEYLVIPKKPQVKLSPSVAELIDNDHVLEASKQLDYGHASPSVTSVVSRSSASLKSAASVETHLENMSIEGYGDSANNTKKRISMKRSAITSLLNDLVFLLEDTEKTSDLIICLETNKILRLHSVVFMARSKWFQGVMTRLKHKNLENGQFQNSSIKYEIKMHCEPETIFEAKFSYISANHFKEFVKYLYTAQCKITEENKEALLAYSRVFEVKGLKRIIFNYILEKLNSNKYNYIQVVNIIRLAYSYNQQETIQKCIDIISLRIKDITKTAVWDDLCNNEPKLVSEILKAL